MVNPFSHTVGFLDDISGDEPVLGLIAIHKRIIIDVSFETVKKVLFVHIDQRRHILQIDLAVFVE